MPITDDTIARIANPPKKEQSKGSTWGKVLVVAGIGVTIFGIIPAIRGTNIKRAWHESGLPDEELEHDE